MIHYFPNSALRCLRSDVVRPTESVQWQGQYIRYFSSDAAATEPFPISFESVLDRWQELPRMYIEPDGSFVWVGEEAGENWQLDGNLYDRNGRLEYVDLVGGIGASEVGELLAGLGLTIDRAVLEWRAGGVLVTLNDWFDSPLSHRAYS